MDRQIKVKVAVAAVQVQRDLLLLLETVVLALILQFLAQPMH
jgi:hypothetical protein